MPMNFRDDPPGQLRDPDETKNPRMWMAHALIYFGNVLRKGKFDKRIGLIPCCKKDIRLFQTSSVVSLDTIELWNFSVKLRAVGKTWLRTLDWTGSHATGHLGVQALFSFFSRPFPEMSRKFSKVEKLTKIRRQVLFNLVEVPESSPTLLFC